MNSNGQIKHQAILEERKRLNLIIQTEIDLLKERINYSKNAFICQAWTIAIIELMEVQRITNNPVKEAA